MRENCLGPKRNENKRPTQKDSEHFVLHFSEVESLEAATTKKTASRVSHHHDNSKCEMTEVETWHFSLEMCRKNSIN